MNTAVRLGATALTCLLATACGPSAPPSDAYGEFEATTVTVSAEVAGPLTHLAVEEGAHLEPGIIVAVVDTTPLLLQRAELVSTEQATVARTAGIEQELAVLSARRDLAQVEAARTERLFAQQAATAQQRDQASSALAVLDRQMAQLRQQREPMQRDVATVRARAATVTDRVRRAVVRNPVGGTVLTRLAEEHEVVQAGQPLYAIGRLDTLTLRAYVDAPTLTRVRLGDNVEVRVDGPRGLLVQQGQVAWIADVAEFTPKQIQTRESRATLVYAVKIRVPNPEGRLRIGMPGEVRFRAAGSAS